MGHEHYIFMEMNSANNPNEQEMNYLTEPLEKNRAQLIA
jgi:hypothetical protein